MRAGWRGWRGATTAAAIACAACGGGDRAAELAADSVALAGAVPAERAASALDDADVAHALVTANTRVVEAARAARSASSNAEVVRFANVLIADHTALSEQATRTARAAGLTPSENGLSRRLEQAAAAADSSVQGLTGDAHDPAFLAGQIAFHATLLDAFDNQLVPSARDSVLKQLLTDIRPALAAHLQRARQLEGAQPAAAQALPADSVPAPPRTTTTTGGGS